jgi:hypothetical protein
MIFQAKKNLRTLSWPAQSPDLNPIEIFGLKSRKASELIKKPLSNLADLD